MNRGYDVIVSNEDKLYMDCGLENWAGQIPPHCQKFIAWRDLYEFDPRQNYLSFPNSQPELVEQVEQKLVPGIWIILNIFVDFGSRGNALV